MKTFPYLFLISLIAISFGAFAEKVEAGGETVDFVDLSRYTGNWYEIARYPNRFQKKCVGNTTANYSFKPNGDIQVVNRCKKADGSYMDAVGKAKVVDRKTNAKLKVSFFWIFYGAYWIIDLDPNYQYAVVGHPDKTYCWILSRTPRLSEGTYSEILQRLEAKGYDTKKLIRTPQN
jgi:apolipoprotein D and lipocalin family protein